MKFSLISGRVLRGSLVALGLSVALSGVWQCQTAQAQEYASKERQRAAIGHYARARAMMVEALEEFEQGRKYARPDVLVEPEQWRLTLISLTEELNRLIDPKPLVTAQGVVFQANPRMVRRESQRLPAVGDGAQDNSSYGEKERMKEIQEARARLYQPKKIRGKKGKPPIKLEPAAEEQAPAPEEEADPETAAENSPPKLEQKQAAPLPAPMQESAGEDASDDESTAGLGAVNPEPPKVERQAETAKPAGQGSEAIENLVRERLKSLESTPAPAEGSAPGEQQPAPAASAASDDFE